MLGKVANTVTASFTAIMGQMTKMSQRKKTGVRYAVACNLFLAFC